jgi:hypothetical protein
MKLLSLSIVGVAVLLLGAAATHDSVASEEGMACTVNCFQDWWQCSPGEHIAPDGVSDERGAGGHDSCWSGSCCVKHPNCYGGCEGGFAALHSAWEEGSVRRIAAELERMGEQVVLNQERGAIQVFGCNSRDVIAHLPLPANALSEVAALIE